ncbi:hypothetical protein [Selenomonas sp. AB3002]|uniref:DUF7694 domain-containing protein n=1 Tax=Selenomonas sp. AB3002 TaxID=1392502 RepID=UPI00068BFEE7
MRTIDEIRTNPQVFDWENWMNGHGGIVQLKGQKKEFNFICTVDKDEETGNEMEHVSVSITNSNKSTPTWKDMCRIKEIFWRDDEEVHQIHPKAENYLHGVGDLENVLHLWRPVGGWGQFEE